MIRCQVVKQEDSIVRRKQHLLVVLVHTNSKFPRSHATPISTERVSCLPGARCTSRMVGRNLPRFLASTRSNARSPGTDDNEERVITDIPVAVINLRARCSNEFTLNSLSLSLPESD